eukprot:CAMPEP_0183355234 /NCGR_PEP_ID=MMETSP0164_2-20130417/39572_1 /TAXON_ID=221442 /ORGANISM="Coccolithus pelagicus ssp braarudi, Strain PLY182g" /LENGTH=123 /DNA_ID=CAMNT_0025528277 /DNA_START=187 /DNA_END=554 /DNA_ORIENTATION=+
MTWCWETWLWLWCVSNTVNGVRGAHRGCGGCGLYGSNPHQRPLPHNELDTARNRGGNRWRPDAALDGPRQSCHSRVQTLGSKGKTGRVRRRPSLHRPIRCPDVGRVPSRAPSATAVAVGVPRP